MDMSSAQALGDADTALRCVVCGHLAPAAESARIRCNVRRFRDRQFGLWRCAGCASLHCEPVADLDAYYAGYPIRAQRLDYFTRSWYREVLRRLTAAGLSKAHRVLDYGCNQGLFIDFLRECGYADCAGYDPFVERFQDRAVLERRYDWVVCLDVIEHDRAPDEFLARLAGLLRPGGTLCLETPNAQGIDLRRAEDYLHAIHVPYHVHILSESGLRGMAQGLGLDELAVYRRWYMDTRPPGTARRLFEGLMSHAGNDLDVGYEPPRLGLFLRHPSLFVHLFLGYWLHEGKTDHMMVMLRAPAAP